jgi:hypothetical protein
MNSIKPKSKRGGIRPGAGRKKGSRNVASADEIKNLAAAARMHSGIALQTLVDVSGKGQSESARVAASIHILDRAFGKASERVELTGKDGAALAVSSEVSLEERSMNEIARRIAFALQKGRRTKKAEASTASS